MAVKATYTIINEKEIKIFKDPKTDNGIKKSARGLVAVVKDENGKETGDVFNPFNYVYKVGQEQTYKKYMKKHYGGTSKNLDDPVDLASYYKHPWRKNQLSDHFPIWIELIIDSSDDFLEAKFSEF